MIVFITFAIAFLVTFLLFPVAIPRLKRAGITGQDMNKPEKPAIAEMGGLIIVIGFIAGIVAIFIIDTYFSVTTRANPIQVLAVLSMTLIMTGIGAIDDLIGVRQVTKAILPLMASLPFVAIKAGHPLIFLPFLGPINLGIISFLVLVPLGITGAANACNMLAGFNGLEIGVSTVAMGALAIIAYFIGAKTSFLILLAALGALLATFRYNWYPAKVFIGDVGTFPLGGIIAAAVILGDFEMAGIIIIIPHAVDFFFKVFHGFPSKGWWGTYKDGKLFCIEAGPVSLPQLVMKIFGGINEKMLVLFLMCIEAIFGAISVLIFA
jgi:UDP-N-acetylglucosamine--dolichyl-phosphate N-acetylglucosaminephosphotransferase